MPDAFFQKKRKRVGTSSGSGSGSAPASGRSTSSRAGPSRKKAGASRDRVRARDSDSDGGEGGGVDDMDLAHRYDEGPSSDAEAEAAETAAEARVRLARAYLDGLRQDEDDRAAGGADAAAIDRDNIASRLQKDVAEQGGKVHAWVASRLARPAHVLAARAHRLSVTAALVAPERGALFTASKDGDIIRWNLRDGRMQRVLPKRPKKAIAGDEQQQQQQPKRPMSKSSGAARRRRRHTAAQTYLAVHEEEGHTDEVWALALSSDGTHLASGGKDKRIGIWGLGVGVGASAGAAEKWIRALGGHKDAISSLSFRPGSSELYTSSFDRTIKLFDVAQLSYIETLFGHQEAILGLSALRAPLAVSAGGRDRTCRLWKIRDESQLVFRAGARSRLRAVLEGGDMVSDAHREGEAIEGSVECVAMVDDGHFVSGGDSGAVCLWDVGRKKPVYTQAFAHGVEANGVPRWVTAIGALAYGDVFATGSWDGSIRVWRLAPSLRSFRLLFDIPAAGVVNSLQLALPPASTLSLDERTSSAVDPALWKRSTRLHADDDRLKMQDDKQDEHEEDEEDEEEGSTQPPAAATMGSKDSVPPILVAALGQEHKFGRWMQIKDARNVALVVPFSFRK